MKRFLLIATWGLVIWGLSLIWPYTYIALTPEVADAVIVGLVIATAAYVLGWQFSGSEAAEVEVVEPASKAPMSSRSTRPILGLAGPGFHARATQPVPVSQGLVVHHSRITRPMSTAR